MKTTDSLALALLVVALLLAAHVGTHLFLHDQPEPHDHSYLATDEWVRREVDLHQYHDNIRRNRQSETMEHYAHYSTNLMVGHEDRLHPRITGVHSVLGKLTMNRDGSWSMGGE